MAKPDQKSPLVQKLLGWTHQWDSNDRYRGRAIQLLSAVLVSVLAIVVLEWLSNLEFLLGVKTWLKGNAIFGSLLFPDRAPAWKDRLQGIVLLLGLPVAFLLWHWRDRNMRDQIENARKDINLKEFQEVQLRAAGALDESLPNEAREQLQIAALHQLRGFLRGDYGEAFKRPALELLLEGHAVAVRRVGIPEDQRLAVGITLDEAEKTILSMRSKLKSIDRARVLIIRDEADHIFCRNYPLDGRRFDLLDLRGLDLTAGGSYRGSHFFGANLERASLEGLDLSHAQFDGAFMAGVSLQGANLNHSSLRSTILYFANLEGTRLGFAKLEGADLAEATYDDNTRISGSSDSERDLELMSEDQIYFQKLGAVHVNEKRTHD